MKKLGLLMLLLASVQTLSAQTAQLGFVQVCKVAGAGVAVGTMFNFTVGGSPIPSVAAGAAPGGTCSAPVQVTAGAVAITETLPAGTVLTGVSTLPSAALLVSSNLAAGTATVTVNAGGQTIVTFTDAVPLALTTGFYFTTYYSNANTTGAPDATVRVINDGVTAGNLYAAIYVFDDSEELQECCACLVTPDGLLSESVNTNLTANPLTGVKPTRGVIKILSSNSGDPTAVAPVGGLHPWATHVQKLTSGFALSETLAEPSNLGAGEQTLLDNLCKFDKMLSGKPCTCTPEDMDF